MPRRAELVVLLSLLLLGVATLLTLRPRSFGVLPLGGLRFVRRFYWRGAVALYVGLAFWLLCLLSPIYLDGSGPSLSLYWGNPPLMPSAHDYFEYPLRFLPRFLVPYCKAALLMTLLGCGLTAWLVRRTDCLLRAHFWHL